ncbi:MAG TPA: methionyl-tRNA formyltransferase [bacterium]|nr:methionyl-tRNA formyltransferase [bacterium]
MKILFMGSSDFGAECLEYLVANNMVDIVITNPDKPAGRGQKLKITPIKEIAIKHNLEIFQPDDINSRESLEKLEKLKFDFIIVVAYGSIISRELLSLFSRKWINIHASLLPKYRGASPINYCLFNGDRETGITIIEMNERMDAGDILLQRKIEIQKDETFGELYKRLQNFAVDVLSDFLEKFQKNQIVKIRQDDSQATYTKKLTTEFCKLEFSESAESLHNKIRGLSPQPGAWAVLEPQNKKLKILRATLNISEKIINDNNECGIIKEKENRVFIKCGCGNYLELLELQIEGKNIIDAKSFINGYLKNREEHLKLK